MAQLDSISAEVRRLLDRLDVATRSGPPPESLLAEISETRQIAVTPELVRLLSVDHADWTRALLRTIGLVLEDMQPDRWLDLESSIRGAWSEHGRRFTTPDKRYAQLASHCHGNMSLLAVLHQLGTLHFNGFVRQAALTELADRNDGAEIACMLCRLNDWVPAIRNAALSAVMSRIKPEYATSFARCLLLLVRVSEGRRADHTEVMEAVQLLLILPEARDIVFSWLKSGHKAVRRAAMSAISTANDPELLRQAALLSGDPVLLREWLRSASESSGQSVALVLLRHPIASLRREALEVLANVGSSSEVDSALQNGLLDRHPSVRATARELLELRGWSQFHQHYLAALDVGSSAATVAALGGLGETGSKEDIERVKSFLTSQMPAARRESLRAIAMLAGDAACDILTKHLADVSPSVSRTASRLLRPHVSAVGVEPLWRIYSECRLPHARRNVLRLLPAASKWDAIAKLLVARCNAEDPELPLIDQLITRWEEEFNRDLTSPTANQRMRAAAALDQCTESLTPHRLSLLRFLIR